MHLQPLSVSTRDKVGFAARRSWTGRTRMRATLAYVRPPVGPLQPESINSARISITSMLSRRVWCVCRSQANVPRSFYEEDEHTLAQ